MLAGLALAASAWAVVRPGTLGAPAGTIAPGENTTALAALRDGRILLAGQSRYGPAADTFVRAYLPGGGVDQTFGNAGEARFAGDHREVVAMAVQPDGKILVGENGAPARLHRLLPAGIADGSFGSAGRVEVDLSDSGTALSDVAAMRDGRIVTVSGAAGTTGPQHVDLRRFLADGSPDPSFGSGGRTVMTLPGLALRPAPAVQPDGSVVFVVEDGDSRVLVARLSPSGAPDPAFGAGGLSPVELPRPGLRPDVRPALGFGWDLVVLRDGRLRIPVTVGPREHVSRIGIVGLTVDGHPDPRFGARGLALGPRRHVREGGEFPQAAVRDARGSILVAGTSASGDDLSGDDAVIVRRFRRDGTLDRSFGRRGLVSDRLHGGGQPYELQLAMLDATPPCSPRRTRSRSTRPTTAASSGRWTTATTSLHRRWSSRPAAATPRSGSPISRPSRRW